MAMVIPATPCCSQPPAASFPSKARTPSSKQISAPRSRRRISSSVSWSPSSLVNSRAAFDETNPIFNRSYIAGGASGNINNLNDNDLPVAPIEMLRIVRQLADPC